MAIKMKNQQWNQFYWEPASYPTLYNSNRQSASRFVYSLGAVRSIVREKFESINGTLRRKQKRKLMELITHLNIKFHCITRFPLPTYTLHCIVGTIPRSLSTAVVLVAPLSVPPSTCIFAPCSSVQFRILIWL